MGVKVVMRNVLIPEGDMSRLDPNIKFENCTTFIQKLRCFYMCYYWIGEEENMDIDSKAIKFLHDEIRPDFIDWCISPFYNKDSTQGNIYYRTITHTHPISRVRLRFHLEFCEYLK